VRNFHFLNYKKLIYFFVPFLAVIFLFGVFFHEKQVRAAVIIVDDPTGEIADNGLCSLPEAIINANNDDQSGSVDCAAGLGADVISLAVDVILSLEYIDNLALPIIEESLIIEGNGFSISRDILGDDMQLAIFDVVGDFTLRNTTISNFSTNNINSQSGVLSPGASFLNITIENSLFINNTHGLIFTDNGSPGEDHWIIRDSVFQNNSAPFPLIRTSIGRDITIENSIFENNQAHSGFDGSILLYLNIGFENTVSISDSIFRNNGNDGFGGSLGFSGFLGETQINIQNTIFENETASSSGGALSIESFADPVNVYISNSLFKGNQTGSSGGAIYMQDWVNLSLTNNLFIDNSAENFAGAIFMNQLAAFPTVLVEARYNTFSGNIAGNSIGNDIYESGASGANSIFENNIFNSGGDECAGDFSNFTFNNNLSNDADCGNLGPVTGLGPLGLYFGSDIPTLRLLDGSNAIDAGAAGDLGCPDEDMVGQIRPNGAGCDIGAFEFYDLASVIIEESDDETIVSEDGTDDTYTIVLDSAPSANVTIDFYFDNTKISISPPSLVFNNSNWDTPQTVTVSAIVDSSHYEDKTDTISHTSTSNDYLFDNLEIDDVSVVVINIHNPPSSSGGSSGGSSTYVPPPPPVLEISGCTTSFATNYNPLANLDDGSCLFLPIEILGCTDSSAKNFNPLANTNNNSCLYDILGCMNPSATNYNPSATKENNTCSFAEPTPPEDAEDPIDQVLPDSTNTSPDQGDNFSSTPSINENNKPPTFTERQFPSINDIAQVIENVKRENIETISYAGVILPAVAFVVTQPAVAVSVPIRLWNLIPTILGFRRRKRPWGTVYDSITKQPIDPAYVSLYDMSGNQIATTITDLDGRFGFLVPSGVYKIAVKKTSYEFPSKKFSLNQKDELYHNLYFGGDISVAGEEDILIKNIPIDSKDFNWNEFEKSKNKDLMKFFSKRDIFIAKIAQFLFYAGLISSFALVFVSPAPINYIVIGIYAILILFKIFGLAPKKPGYVHDSNGFPMSFGIIRVFSKDLNREVAHTVIGKTGKYYVLVSNGEYYIKIQQKIGENEYKEVFTSDSFLVKNGYIGKNFKI
jgi:predicted outer membrane repeat protein